MSEPLEPRRLLADIAGFIYQDLNGNGKKDSGENGVNAFSQTIFIDSNNNGLPDSSEPSTSVDQFGNYDLSVSTTGTYRVTLEQDQNQFNIRTAPAVDFINVNITSTGQTVNNVNFGIAGLASVQGTVYNDANSNGKQDTGEPTLAGAKPYIDINNNGTLDSATVTNSSASNLNLNTTNATGVASDITVSNASGFVTHVTVTVNVTTSNANDPQMFLENPQGVRVLLVTPSDTANQDTKQNFTNTTFDEAAAKAISDANAPFTGSFQTSGHAQGEGLEEFNNISANGRWRLILQNTAVGTPMVLKNWSLKITSGDPTQTTMNQGSYYFPLQPGTFNIRVADTNFTTTQPSSGKVTATIGQGDSNVATFGLHETSTRNQTVTFAPSTNLSKGTSDSPFSVVTYDFNKDGILDLAVSNNGSNDVSIYIGQGAGKFKAPVFMPAGMAPRGLSMGDFNADGKMDLAVANNNSNNVGIYLGKGDGTFQTAKTFTAAAAWAIAVGDYNKDGKLDLAVADNGAKDVQILLGKGDGTFTTGTKPTAGVFPNAIATADFNGDKNLDLVVANMTDNSLTILLGKGNGAFSTGTTIDLGLIASEPDGVAVGDFNGDGKIDIATADYGSNNVDVYLGNGNGTFTYGDTLYAGDTPAAVIVTDLNQDGKPDLVVANRSDGGTPISGSVQAFLGKGDGTFNDPFTYTTHTSPIGLAAGDFNGDGYPDLAVGNFNSDDVSVLLNTTKPAGSSGGSISGSVKNGSTGVSGETVYLDANNNSKPDTGELKTTTTSTGSYSFSNVPAGAYIIRQVLLSDETQTSPSNGTGIHVSVSSGGSLTNENFVDVEEVPDLLMGTVIGTSGSNKNDGNTIAKAFDNNLSSYFDGPTANGNWAGLDLGTSETISRIAFAPRSGYASRMVGGKFQISTKADFSSGVTTIYTISSAPASGSLTTITLSSPVTARYVRYLSPDGGYGNVAEIAFYG